MKRISSTAGTRPDLLIITRATLDRNVTQMHQAGADLVLSYATLGARAVIDCVKDVQEMIEAEGAYCVSGWCMANRA